MFILDGRFIECEIVICPKIKALTLLKVNAANNEYFFRNGDSPFYPAVACIFFLSPICWRHMA